MDITKSSNKLSSSYLVNGETVGYSVGFSLGLFIFLIIKQILKNIIGIGASVAMPISFCVVSILLFVFLKKYVFTKKVGTKLPRQILFYLFTIIVDIGLYKLFDFTLAYMLKLSSSVAFFVTIIVSFVFNFYFNKLIVFDTIPKPEETQDTKLYSLFFRNRYVILSMLVACVGILFVYALFKLFPFGDITVLRMDLYHQYGPLFVEFYDRILGLKSFLYSWESGGGSSFLGNYFNYLSSPLSFLVLLFDRNQIGYAISTLVIVKGVLSAGTFCYYLKKSQKGHSFASASLGVLYAFSGYFLAYYWNIMWIDGMILLPLIALGIERIINDGKSATYIAFLGLLLYSNYYMGYMACIFSIVYFLVYFFANYEAGDTIAYNGKIKPLSNRFFARGLRFAVSSLAVGLICACFLIPVYFILQSCSATSDNFPNDFSSYFNIIDMISSHLAGLETTIRSSGNDVLPNIYCGMLSMIMLPLFVMNKDIKLKEKISYIVLLLFFVFSFDNNVANFIWHAFHMPNDLPYRFSFMYVFVVLSMAFKCLSKIKGVEIRDIAICGIGVIMLILFFQRFPTNKISEFSIYISLAFAMIWTLVLMIVRKGNLSKLVIGVTIICMTFSEVIVADSNSYVFTQKQESYVNQMETYENAISYINENDDDKFRIELSHLDTRMDPCLYGYNGMSAFSSVAYQVYSQTQYNLGLFGNRINSYTYNLQTPIYNMLYNLKYIIRDSSTKEMSGLYYKKAYTTDDKHQTEVYENKYYLPIAFLGNSTTTDWINIEGNPFDVQQDLLTCLTGVEDVFIPVDYVKSEAIGAKCESITSNGIFRIDSNSEGYAGGSVEVTFTSKVDGNVYIYIDCNNIENINYYWNDNEDSAYQNISEPYIFDLGVHSAGEEIRASLDLSNITNGGANVEFYGYTVDNDKLNDAYIYLNKSTLDVTKHNDTTIEGTIDADYDGCLYTSIPFDEGWSIYIDGEKVDTVVIGDSQLGANITSGEHTVKMKYRPKGLLAGGVISLATIIAIAGYILLCYKKQNRDMESKP